MTKKSRAHEQVVWAKHKLDEFDATMATIERKIGQFDGNARKEAEQALDKLKSARSAAGNRLDAMLDDIAAAKETAGSNYEALLADLADAELALQNFLSAASEQADVVKETLLTRATAQRESWNKSVDELKANASQTVAQAYDELDAALAKLSEAQKKAEAKAEKVSSVGGEVWKAIKDGIEETHAVRQRTWKKISEALTGND